MNNFACPKCLTILEKDWMTVCDGLSVYNCPKCDISIAILSGEEDESGISKKQWSETRVD